MSVSGEVFGGRALRRFKQLFLIGSVAGLGACASLRAPENGVGSLYAAQQAQPGHAPSPPLCTPSPIPAEIATRRFVPAAELSKGADILAPGDRVRLTVAGDTDQLTGGYVVATDGVLTLAGQVHVRAAGVTVGALEAAITGELTARSLVRPLTNGVRLQLVELAPVTVSVDGAVFEAGPARVGERQAEVRALAISNTVVGDSNAGRTLSTALRAVGGVRPDADERSIYLIRGDRWTRIDMSGALDGRSDVDVTVASGDRIIVPSVGCLQERLVRPSLITTPGIRVFMSNLSRPASNNASSAIGKEATSLPYGTRFLQGLVSANCVGGSAMNADRRAVLISRNPVTGKSVVIARAIENLVRHADRDNDDPYLMPGDAIACYDSAAMNLRDVVSVVSDTVTPVVLFRNVK